MLAGHPVKMEDLPKEYTEHNLPLVLLSGLGEDSGPDGGRAKLPREESGTRISLQSTECQGDRARALRQQLMHQDGRDLAWSAKALAGPTGTMKYAMKSIGRVGMPFVVVDATVRILTRQFRHTRLLHGRLHRHHSLQHRTKTSPNDNGVHLRAPSYIRHCRLFRPSRLYTRMVPSRHCGLPSISIRFPR